ncbi:MAG: helicase C-terminal domain-containing protein [Candidatus Hodarchaeota archaeon]
MTIQPSIDFFPFDSLKPAQGVMLHRLSKERYVFVQAPTGFGKTAVALSVVLPEILNGKQIIVATRTKNQIFDIYLKWLSRFSAHKKVVNQVTCVPLIAREDLCVNPDKKNDLRSDCRGCKTYKQTEEVTAESFPVLSDYIRFSATSPSAWRESLLEWGCPYQLVKRLCPFVDIVLTTHGYLLQPHLRSKLFSLTQTDLTPQTKVLLLDEVHGLATPAVVAELPLKTLRAAAQVYPTENLLTFVKHCRYPGQVQRPPIHPELILYYLSKDESRWQDPTFQPLVALYEFLIAQGDYWICTEKALLQLNPFPDMIFKAFNGFYKVIGMSGTLKPLNMYLKLFDIPHYVPLEIPTPVDRQFLAVTTELQFSTKFENRNVHTFRRYAQAIHKLHVLNPEHTLVCCASYEIKKRLLSYFDTPYVEQQRLPRWLSELPTLEHELIMAVMGGRLTEGIEILNPETRRSKLTLIIIVGLPFPPKDVLTNILTYLYERRYSVSQAEQYLLHLPALTSVLQAIGRGIRSPHDYSAAIVLDHRAVHFPLGSHQQLYSQFDILLRDLFGFYRRQQRA